MPSKEWFNISGNLEAERIMLKDPFAVYFQFSGAADAIPGYPCSITMLPESYSPQYWAYGMPKNSSLLKLFNHRIFLIRQAGLWQSSFNNIPVIKEQSCDLSTDQTSYRELGYENIFSAFVALAFGMALAGLFILVEKWYKIIHRSKRRNRNERIIHVKRTEKQYQMTNYKQ